MKVMIAAVLFGITGAFLLLAYFSISLIWSGGGDSPDSTYLKIGLMEIGIAAVFAVGGALVVRRR
jgi:hypothetical protein